MSPAPPEPWFSDPDPDDETVEIQRDSLSSADDPSTGEASAPDPSTFDQPVDLPPPRRRRREKRTARTDLVAAGEWLRRRVTRPDLAPRERRFRLGAATFLLVLFFVLAFTGGEQEDPSEPPAGEVLGAEAVITEPEVPLNLQVPEDRTLELGDSGRGVKRLQRALNELGYAAGEVDGLFGDGTRTAVEAFQIANNLTADGAVGPQTASAINEAIAESLAAPAPEFLGDVEAPVEEPG